MLGVSLSDRIKDEVIRQRTRVTSHGESVRGNANVKMHRWSVEPKCALVETAIRQTLCRAACGMIMYTYDTLTISGK